MRAIGFGSGRRRALLAVWLPALAVAATLGCERDQGPGDQAPGEPGRPGAFGPASSQVSAADIIDDPDSFVGKEVTVEGEVQRTAGAQAYVIDGGMGEGDLLVLGAPPRKEGDEVQVTGQVRILEVPAVERELGRDIEPDIEREFAQKPVLMARRAAQQRPAAPAGAPPPPADAGRGMPQGEAMPPRG